MARPPTYPMVRVCIDPISPTAAGTGIVALSSTGRTLRGARRLFGATAGVHFKEGLINLDHRLALGRGEVAIAAEGGQRLRIRVLPARRVEMFPERVDGDVQRVGDGLEDGLRRGPQPAFDLGQVGPRDADHRGEPSHRQIRHLPLPANEITEPGTVPTLCHGLQDSHSGLLTAGRGDGDDLSDTSQTFLVGTWAAWGRPRTGTIIGSITCVHPV
jgi:hypothetical protein